jgi:hypothetical protein
MTGRSVRTATAMVRTSFDGCTFDGSARAAAAVPCAG